jgi:HEPN domain-containing protein
MVTRKQLQDLAQIKLQEAEALFEAGFFDGCAYLCGYVVEFALKARICSVLHVDEYPEKGSRLREALRTHSFDDLVLLAGMGQEFTANYPGLFTNWLIGSKWAPDWRYNPQGSYDRLSAKRILDAVRSKLDGVLICISSHW